MTPWRNVSLLSCYRPTVHESAGFGNMAFRAEQSIEDSLPSKWTFYSYIHIYTRWCSRRSFRWWSISVVYTYISYVRNLDCKPGLFPGLMQLDAACPVHEYVHVSGQSAQLFLPPVYTSKFTEFILGAIAKSPHELIVVSVCFSLSVPLSVKTILICQKTKFAHVMYSRLIRQFWQIKA